MYRLVRAVTAIACSVFAISCGGAPTTPSAAPTTAASVPPLPSAPVSVSGGTFTFSIDSACRAQFPEAVQQRSYPATFRSYPAPAGSEYAGGVLTLAEGVFRTDLDGGEWNLAYRSTTDGATTYSFDEPPIWEWLSGDQFLVIDGSSTYHGTSPYGEWSFSGSVFYCASATAGQSCAIPEIICQSDHHRLRVTQVLPAAG